MGRYLKHSERRSLYPATGCVFFAVTEASDLSYSNREYLFLLQRLSTCIVTTGGSIYCFNYERTNNTDDEFVL